MENDVAIKVENISKYYRLGVINNGVLFRDIQTWISRKRGKEDPYSTIGTKYDPTVKGFWALKDLNFEIKKGDRVGIIGHNGAGKSTLLKILSGITTPTEGTIKINGKISSLLEVGTGFHPEMTGRENIYLNGAILGMKRREIDSQIDEIIEFSEIKEHIDTPVKRYSSGMYVRLAFAVAAHLNNDILIADEVLAVGDAAFQKKALGKMNELSSGKGRTVLFVSHNMAQVKNLCNKGIVLEKGRIIRKEDDISKAISFYLGKNDDNTDIETTCWENPEKIFNESFNPQRIEIQTQDGETVTSALDYDKDYRLVLDVDILKPEPNIDFWFDIYFNSEKIFGIPMPEIQGFKQGRNLFSFNIAKRTFLPGNYTITLGSTVKNTKWIIKPEEFVAFISLHVMNTKSKILNLID